MNTPFHTITPEDFNRSIRWSRNTPNAILQRWISRWAFIGLALGPGCANAAPVREPLEIRRMVEVLRQLENGPASNPWQFTDATWNHYSKQPMKTAPMAEHLRVAWMFVGECCRQCSSLEIPITPYYVGLMWNAGIGNYMSKKLTKDHWDFADRANNLYHATP